MSKKNVIIVAIMLSLLGFLGLGYFFVLNNDIGIEFINNNSNFVWQKKYKVTIKTIDSFLELYEKDFESDIKKNFRNDFLKFAKDKIIFNNKDLKAFLEKSNPEIQDKFKTWYFSANFKDRLPQSGIISYKKENNIKKAKENAQKFDYYYKKIEWQEDKTRKELFLKFEKMLSSGDISINGQLNDEVAQKILNMQTIELYNFVSERKNHIVFKILQGSPDVDVAIKNLGIDFKIKDELLKDLNSYRLLKEMFLEHKQYEKLKKYVLSNDIKNIELVLQNVLSENQKKILLENKTDIEHLAKNLVNIGLYSPYNWRYIEKNWGDSTDRIQGTLTLDGKKSYKMSEVAFETPYKPDKSTEKLFKEVFKNLLFADINQEHNQIGDVINEINRNYKMPKTIINFDSHSDMYGQHAFQDGTIFIADWVNWALAQENVEKMIWVIPEESIKTNPSAKYLYFDYMPYHSHTLNGNFDHTQIPDYLGKTPFIQKIWIDRDNFLILPSLNNNKPQGNVKVVEFIMCTISSLPDLKNEDILLSLDGDYFHCSGYNTQGYISNMPIDINKTFKDFIEALYSKNIRPKFLNCSISVRYVGYERNDELYGFFKYILKISNKKDKIKGYVGKIGQNFTQKDITEISAF